MQFPCYNELHLSLIMYVNHELSSCPSHVRFYLTSFNAWNLDEFIRISLKFLSCCDLTIFWLGPAGPGRPAPIFKHNWCPISTPLFVSRLRIFTPMHTLPRPPVRLLAELSKRNVLADPSIDYGVRRAIVVMRFAMSDFHRALSGARRQSDEVDSVHEADL
jgi:hypothetical protein